MSEVIVYSADVRPLYEADAYRAARERVSRTRAEKADRFVFAKDRALCLGAGLLLDMGLRAYGLTEKDAAVVYGRYGKPSLDGHPEICFSLSHSGERVTAAFAAHEIGCDIERCGPVDALGMLRFFAFEERELLQDTAEPERTSLFYRLWTLKESFLKNIGTGLTVPPEQICVLPTDGDIRVRQLLSIGPFAFAEPDIAPDYHAAVCVKDAECTVRLITVDRLI